MVSLSNHEVVHLTLHSLGLVVRQAHQEAFDDVVGLVTYRTLRLRRRVTVCE